MGSEKYDKLIEATHQWIQQGLNHTAMRDLLRNVVQSLEQQNADLQQNVQELQVVNEILRRELEATKKALSEKLNRIEDLENRLEDYQL